MLNRRKLIKHLSSLPLLGGIAGSSIPLTSALATPKAKRDVVKELGIRTFINAAGTYTAMTASLMPEEVMETIQAASHEFMMLEEVQDKVGERIAKLVHSEAAMVTAGCWSAMVLGMAGVLTGTDPKKVAQLPHLEYTGMKSQVLVQKAHNTGYVHALTNTGVMITEIETLEEAEKAINERTALLWFLNYNAPLGKIQHQEWVALGKKHNIPTMIDMAADVPPVENLWKYNDMGFDLVCVSGGKAMRGPQSTGLLMGKKDLIAAARLNGPPRGGNIGRGMKVNKEEILGMYVALERYINLDHAKEWKEWETRIAQIESAVKKVNGIQTEKYVPPVANHTPALRISWNESSIKLSPKDLQEKLRNGNPSIEVVGPEKDATSVSLTVFMLKPGQDKIVAKRLAEEFSKATIS
ncbi:aminotransferase class V-fold PLP-dependent enzyme [Rhodocytophaga rosea]|uniref:Aminotransferase class V-fold PLP-dependent enzyme n=1 Tax=Rhodocytophaga rosea TaxID=2704465 RepID=A0A6C0GF50_9BACT|nr:aminotransferase class V-fold PLP-dependent enzyme [Rhodocytophaga rosea]QHT66547.1 aminotransferase class V-fold PLP-dependent enzyme [Rhodocytophaga rosea]